MSQKYEYFGKYILLEKLAMGGMAEVWLARAPGAGGLGKFVAIKKILPQYSDNTDFIQMFRDEAAIAMNLSHSNIVSIYEFGQEDQQLFLVMDYVEGRNLRQILNKIKVTNQRFNTEQIVYMVREVAAGLDHAHRSVNAATGKPLNITHRDMSPQNIMISFEGEVTIVDFGIAKAEEIHVETTKTGTLKGKFGYMSPEQAEGQSTDLRTDIFSLGIVLWELLANDRLFIANNEINTLRKIRECNVPSLAKINPNIHPELERIVMKALTRDRNLRYQTAAALHRDLSRYLNRSFPDFSPQDFSVFIKNIYADEILETRNRLIEYSKIPFKNEMGKQVFVNEDKTQITTFKQTSDTEQPSINLHTNPTQTKSSTIKKFEQEIPSPKKTEQTITETETDTEGKQNQAEAKKPMPELPKFDLPLLSEHTQNVLNANALKKSLERIGTNPRSDEFELDFGNNGKVRSHAANKKRKQKSSSFVANFMFFLAFMLGTYIVGSLFFPQLTNSLSDKFAELIGENKKNNSQVGNINQNASSSQTQQQLPLPVKEPIATPSTKAIIVNSDPSGAQIFIDGTFTGKSTPARVQIPVDRNFQLKLVKERYLEYLKEDVSPESISRSFNANLQKAFIAYIDIDVNPSVGVKVFVDGKYLKDEQLPIERYAIPAGKDVVIKAQKALTNETVTETVRLNEDEKQSLRLDFNKRRPSSK